MNLKKIVRKAAPRAGLSVLESSYRRGRGAYWQARFGFPARHAKVIAVTGTNGKTTTANYINKVLQANGLKTALWTSENIEVGGVKRKNLTHFTLQKQSYVQKFFAEAKKARTDWVILEVTSHALDQHRIQGVPIEIAVLTNLSPEHLDYHKSIDNYARAKARLFGREYRPRFCILNADDEWFEFFKSKCTGETVSYGLSSGADFWMSRPSESLNGSWATVAHKNQKIKLKTRLLGQFNLHNALAAYAVGRVLKLDEAEIRRGIELLPPVPGRMNLLKGKRGVDVVIDFAVTPDALKQALGSLKKISGGKVAVVFGATGDRDKTKRPLLGEVAGLGADKIYLTDDETYSEDGGQIRKEVMAGIKKAKASAKTKELADREQAIKTALQEAEKGDIVLLSGMGSYKIRRMGNKDLPWDEKMIVEKYLNR